MKYKKPDVINYELFINNLNSIKEKISTIMHNKDKVIFDKKLPYEYNIANIILSELYNKGINKNFL